MKRILGLSSILVASVISQAVFAETELSGFVTAGATYGDFPEAPAGSPEIQYYDGSFTDHTDMSSVSRLGIQISSQVNKQVSMTGQLLAKSYDGSERYNVKADWAFVTYKPIKNTAIRVGKLKLTSYLISDYYEVGYAYPWVRPPQEVYSTNPITAVEGIDALIRFNFGNSSLLIQPYAGSNHDTPTVQPQETMYDTATWAAMFVAMGFTVDQALLMALEQPEPGTVNYIEFTTKKLGGINIAFSNPYFTVRAGHFSTRVYQEDFGVDGDRGAYTSAGLTVDWKNVVVYAETFKREVEGMASMAFPNQKGNYFTLGYRFGPLLVHATHARLASDDVSDETFMTPAGPQPSVALEQESTGLGIRYELGSGAAFKLEVTETTPEMGTRGLLVSDPNDSGLEDPSKSVRLYSMALDVIF
ncbi:MAG: hypothetical protein IME93_01265 [Proteobacteria bacterium]|nr:hypothetical protein [Pseudomonadota bacterium]